VWLVAGCAVEETDPRQCTLLRARPERPRDGCTAEQCDELAPLHSITSLARGRNDSGIVKPSVLAVTRQTRCVVTTPGRRLTLGGSGRLLLHSIFANRVDMAPGLRELIALSLLAGLGCGLALGRGDLIFVTVFGAACTMAIIGAMQRFP